MGKQELPLLEGTHRILCAPGPSEINSDLMSLGQTYLLVLEDLLHRQGATVAHYRNKNTVNGVLRSTY